ncbi:uncharacterized protein N7511_001315 [Penicillium nucicola]|uniref:uncharacterized protein n=1 Tax=Penicillium nucicola TaxID=1850975 RepID=UPI0025452088|nr:uncharacterized protein N7511_001315 [Penicillium nucicola]KAJ5776304.1 hypothetical protein N7511_001315 [Penicillium nucicola]
MACNTIVAGRIHSVKKLLSALILTTKTCPTPGPELRDDSMPQLPTQGLAMLTAVPTSNPDDLSPMMSPPWHAETTSMGYEDMMHLIHNVFND